MAGPELTLPARSGGERAGRAVGHKERGARRAVATALCWTFPTSLGRHAVAMLGADRGGGNLDAERAPGVNA